MPWRRQTGTGNIVFHVMNRGARRMRLFDTADDYRAFLRCVSETKQRIPIRLLAYCVMPNHFHLVAWPTEDSQLADFMHLMTGTHGRRWNVWRDSVGVGAVYQSRYKAFPVQSDRHFLTVCKYVERNALAAELVLRAEDWPWSSLAGETPTTVSMDDWPVPRPRNWLTVVNEPEAPRDMSRIRRSIRRGIPFGESGWTRTMATRLGLQERVRPVGRPRKPRASDNGPQG